MLLNMNKYTRQEAKVLGIPICFGSPCKKHPEFNGERRVSGACVECARKHTRDYREKNPEKYLQHAAKSNAKVAEKRRTDPEVRAAKLAYDKQYRKTNPDKVAAIKRNWATKNPGATTELAIRRKAAIKLRTPKWLSEGDKFFIREAYILASLRTKMLGYKWEVDHIIPLQGDKVSGLHTPANLRVIPRSLNRAKWNRFEVA